MACSLLRRPKPATQSRAQRRAASTVWHKRGGYFKIAPGDGYSTQFAKPFPIEGSRIWHFAFELEQGKLGSLIAANDA
jgi:hypothetical protein